MNLLRRSRMLSAVVLLLTAQQLPAPISEVESPTPTPERSAKPRQKQLPKPKPKPEPSALATSPVKQQAAKQSRFAGTWVGTIMTFPPGNTGTVLTVDATETTMALTWNLSNPSVEKATISGDTIQTTFGRGNIGAATFSLTPQPDGVTATVRLQAFMNDFTAVFHRAADANAAKTAK